MCGFAGVVQRDGRLPGDVSALAVSLGRALAHRGPDGVGRLAGAGRQRPARAPPARHHRSRPRRRAADGHARRPVPHRVQRRDLQLPRAARGSAVARRALRDRQRHRSAAAARLARGRGPARRACAGMFAFACWDTVERSLLVARDRFGIKPLYIAAGPRHIAFASELGALRASNLGGGETSAAGVLAFLRVGQRAAAAHMAARRGHARTRHLAAVAARRPRGARRVRGRARRVCRRFGARDARAADGRPGVSRRGRARRARERPRASGRRRARRRVPLRRHRLGRARLLRHVGRRVEPADVHRGFRR